MEEKNGVFLVNISILWGKDYSYMEMSQSWAPYQPMEESFQAICKLSLMHDGRKCPELVVCNALVNAARIRP